MDTFLESIVAKVGDYESQLRAFENHNWLNASDIVFLRQNCDMPLFTQSPIRTGNAAVYWNNGTDWEVTIFNAKANPFLNGKFPYGLLDKGYHEPDALQTEDLFHAEFMTDAKPMKFSYKSLGLKDVPYECPTGVSKDHHGVIQYDLANWYKADMNLIRIILGIVGESEANNLEFIINKIRGQGIKKLPIYVLRPEAYSTGEQNPPRMFSVPVMLLPQLDRQGIVIGSLGHDDDAMAFAIPRPERKMTKENAMDYLRSQEMTPAEVRKLLKIAASKLED